GSSGDRVTCSLYAPAKRPHDRGRGNSRSSGIPGRGGMAAIPGALEADRYTRGGKYQTVGGGRTMEQRKLGRSGLEGSASELGGNTFGGTVDGDEAVAVIRRGLELGINFVDTADIYS